MLSGFTFAWSRIMRRITLSILSFLLTLNLLSANNENDTIKYLLLDFAMQVEITDAIDDMYNFNFRSAEVEFNWMKFNHPEHPLPYFLYGISTWWQMMPNLEKENGLGEEFLAYMDSTITKAKVMYKADESNMEAAFFLAGAYGFKGRYLSERKFWTRAAGAGKQALKYLEKTQGNESFSPEILFGDALFNYYSIWIRENYPMLKPILLFFPKGDKQLGIQQMEEVSRNAFYTRVEALYFLMRIKAYEEKKTFDALRIGEYVFKKYPNNPYFHRFYARMLYTTGQYDSAEAESLDILEKLEAKQLGYEEISGKYASFFLGDINKRKGNKALANQYFQQAVDFTEAIEDEESGYYLYSQLYLAQSEEEANENESALERVEIIRDNTKRKSSLNEQAKALKKKIRKKR